MNQNSRLELATLITSFGDFVTFYATLFYIHSLTNNVLLAAYTVPVQSLGVAFGGLVFPYLASRFRLKNLLGFSQWLSAVLILLLLFLTRVQSDQMWLFFTVYFFISFLSRLFLAAREALSKSFGDVSAQRGLQAQILRGFYSAQFLGPIVAFFLLTYFHISISLWLDLATFLVSAFICMSVDHQSFVIKSSIFRPFSYLLQPQKRSLMMIFFLRSVAFWFPAGMFNYFMYDVIKSHYDLDILKAAFMTAFIGLGAIFATQFLRSKVSKLASLQSMSDAKIATFALSGLGLTKILLVSFVSIPFAIFILIMDGLFMGFNAIATQSIRRKVTDNNEFSEIVGLEFVTGKGTEWMVATLGALSAHWLGFDFFTAMILTTICYVLVGLMHLHPALREV